MACKYLKIKQEFVQEVDGSMIPSFFETAYCELGRDEVGMIPKCKATPYNGHAGRTGRSRSKTSPQKQLAQYQHHGAERVQQQDVALSAPRLVAAPTPLFDFLRADVVKQHAHSFFARLRTAKVERILSL